MIQIKIDSSRVRANVSDSRVISKVVSSRVRASVEAIAFIDYNYVIYPYDYFAEDYVTIY